MSQSNNNNNNASLIKEEVKEVKEEEVKEEKVKEEKEVVETEQKPIKNEFQFVHVDEDDLELEEQYIPREKTIRGPLILVRDSDIYIVSNGTTKIFMSWITNKEVPNRRLNERTGYSEKIDPTIEEEDRRLLIPNAILAELSKGTTFPYDPSSKGQRSIIQGSLMIPPFRGNIIL